MPKKTAKKSQTDFRKITLFYGHVASNIGDLAINKGEIELLKQAYPGALINIILLDSAASDFLRLARTSFGDDPAVTLTFYTATYTKALEYQTAPTRFLDECGAADADLIVLASGEHLFTYAAHDNTKSLYWRTLPALAARASGKCCIQLPATFGPFEIPESLVLMTALASVTDAIAAREPTSAAILATRADVRGVPVFLDPAFFIPPSVGKDDARTKTGKTLGLAMRSEGWGIRLPKEERANAAEKLKADPEGSLAFQFSVALCREFLAEPDARAIIFVQTTADEELAENVKAKLTSEGFGERIRLQRPLSVDEYVELIASVDYVVASRFHAIILSAVANTPAFGVYFDAHGHKMPGLFELLSEKENCINLSAVNAESAAKSVFHARERMRESLPALQELLQQQRAALISWLREVSLEQIEGNVLVDAYRAFGVLAADQVRRGFQGAQRKETEARVEVQAERAIAAEKRLAVSGRKLAEAMKAEDALKIAHDLELKSLADELKQQERKTADALRHAREDAAREIAALKAAHENDVKVRQLEEQKKIAEIVKLARQETDGEIAALNAAHAGDLEMLTEEASQQQLEIVALRAAGGHELEALTEERDRRRAKLDEEIAALKVAHETELKETVAREVEAAARSESEKALLAIATLKEAHIETLKLASANRATALKVAVRNATERSIREIAAMKAAHAAALKTVSAQKVEFALDKANKKFVDEVVLLKAYHDQELDLVRRSRVDAEVDRAKQDFARERDMLERLHRQDLDGATRAQMAMHNLHKHELERAREEATLEAEKQFQIRQRQEVQLRDLAAATLEAAASAAEARASSLQNSTSFKVGTMFLAALRNPLKMLAFPVNAIRAQRAAHSNKEALKARGTILSADQARKIRESYGFRGYEGATKLIAHMNLDPAARAVAFKIIQQYVQSMMPEPGTTPALEWSGSPKPAARAKSNAATMPVIDSGNPTNVVAVYNEEGAPFIVKAVTKRFGENKREAARELLRLSTALRMNGIPEAEYPLTQAAAKLDRSEAVLRALFWAHQREKQFMLACDVMFELKSLYGAEPNTDQQQFIDKMQKSPAFQLSLLRGISRKRAVAIGGPKKLCYILHNTLPYSSGGYATRSHGVLTGIRDAGWEVIAISRPGFPLDLKSATVLQEPADVDVVDGIPYMRIFEPKRENISAYDYMRASADALEARLREIKPTVVMAASNHVTGLPALIAASRLGIPFVYEIRGLWEITRVSREPTFENNASFHVQRTLEASVTKGADHAFTLTEPMREELIARGVDADKLDLLPNSCDPSRFQPRDKDQALMARLGIPAGVPIIGYIGTFVDYEGLEDLAEACGLLKKRGTEFRLLMVGNENASGQTRGPITEWIEQVARDNDFADWTILTGRVPHEEVESYYSLLDICPFPRKAWPVCEMVSPMKPLEALAMEKAVVVSSVRALVEMIKDGETGLVFEKSNIASLADTLQRAIDDPQLRARLGKAGRIWVEQERTWTQVGRRFAAIVDAMLNEPSAAIADTMADEPPAAIAAQ